MDSSRQMFVSGEKAVRDMTKINEFMTNGKFDFMQGPTDREPNKVVNLGPPPLSNIIPKRSLKQTDCVENDSILICCVMMGVRCYYHTL